MKVVYSNVTNEGNASALQDFTCKFLCSVAEYETEHSYSMIFRDEWELQGCE